MTRRKRADLQLKIAQLGAPSRLKGVPSRTRAPFLEKVGTDGKMDRNLQGRTDTVHDHFKELFTDPLHWVTPGMGMAAMATGGAAIPSTC